MNTKLDQSHLTLIKGWNTFQRMKQCGEEIEGYLESVIEEVGKRLIEQYPSSIAIYNKKLRNDNRWFDVDVLELSPNRRRDSAVLTIGIERIHVDRLVDELVLHTVHDLCRAYAYFPHKQTNGQLIVFNEIADVFRRLPAPSGFTVSINQPEGYFATRPIAPITAESLINPHDLQNRFLEPLTAMIDWLQSNASAFGPIVNRAGTAPQ